MNHAGEIAPLSTMLRPHVWSSQCRGGASGIFADIEAIADAKAEIFAGLEATAWRSEP